MLTEPHIDRKEIQSKIEENYGIKVSQLSHIKAGEASWGYKVETSGQGDFFFKIHTGLEELRELGDKLRKQHLDFVICHGEPHDWNTMIDDKGEVFLIDWDDCLFAPKEKDLIMIKGDQFKMDGYKSVVGEFELNQEVINYYALEWDISEVDAWSSQILNDNTNDIKNQHDLDFLISCLRKLTQAG